MRRVARRLTVELRHNMAYKMGLGCGRVEVSPHEGKDRLRQNTRSEGRSWTTGPSRRDGRSWSARSAWPCRSSRSSWSCGHCRSHGPSRSSGAGGTIVSGSHGQRKLQRGGLHGAMRPRRRSLNCLLRRPKKPGGLSNRAIRELSNPHVGKQSTCCRMRKIKIALRRTAQIVQ